MVGGTIGPQQGTSSPKPATNSTHHHIHHRHTLFLSHFPPTHIPSSIQWITKSHEKKKTYPREEERAVLLAATEAALNIVGGYASLPLRCGCGANTHTLALENHNNVKQGGDADGRASERSIRRFVDGWTDWTEETKNEPKN